MHNPALHPIAARWAAPGKLFVRCEMKTYLITFASVFVFRMAVYMCCFKPITDYALQKNNTLYLYLFEVFLHLLCGVIIGWFCKTKGWLLGLILGISVVVLSAVQIFTSDFFKDEVTRMGGFGMVSQIALSPTSIIIISCLVLGGYIGNKLRAIKAS